MRRYSLRTLLVVMLVSGPAIGGIWWLAGYAETLVWLMRVGMALVVVHGLYAVAAPLPGQSDPVKVSALFQVGLWLLQVAGLFIPMCGLCLSIGSVLFRNNQRSQGESHRYLR